MHGEVKAIESSREYARNVLLQANFRVKFGLGIAALLLGLYAWGPYPGESSWVAILGLASLYAAYALAVKLLAGKPAPFTHRDVVMITAVLDAVFMTAWLFIAGHSSILFVGLLLFTILGHGFRIGALPMHVCQVVSIIGFATVAVFADAWEGQGLFALSYLIMLLLVPVYASFLIQRITHARALAERESQAKTQLLAKVSHELRTPLTGITAAAQLIEDEAHDGTSLRRAKSIQHLAGQLDAEIRQLLDLARIENRDRHQVDPSAPFSVAYAVTCAFKSLETLAAGKDVKVRIEYDERIRLPVVGRFGDLVAVLTNLAGNAVKFTDSGSIVLRAALVAETMSSYRIRFAVQDTGIGIAPEHLDRLFEPFYQVNTDPRVGRGGTGLGTTIAREIVARLGGQLRVDSEPGRGSTFHFEIDLPVEQVPAAAQVPSRTPAPQSGFVPRKVLVADDNAVNLTLLEEMLAKEGHQVTAVGSGHEAVFKLGTEQFDILFLDYNMRDVDGATVYRTYSFSHVRVAPTFFVTADATSVTEQMLSNLGATGVIHKPVTFEKLRQCFAQVFPMDSLATGRSAPAQPAGQEAQAAAVPLRAVPAEYVAANLLDNLREVRDTPVFLHRVMSEAIADMEELQAGIDAALDAADVEQVQRCAHALKGAALNMCAYRLANLADQLMHQDAMKILAGAATWKSDVSTATARTVEELDRLRRPFAPDQCAQGG